MKSSIRTSSVKPRQGESRDFVLHFNLHKDLNRKKHEKDFDDKERMTRVRRVMGELRVRKSNEAKELREMNRIMKENMSILRQKVVYENSHRRKLVECGRSISSNAIQNYKDYKKSCLNDLEASLYEKEMLRVLKRRRELDSWIGKCASTKTILN